MTKKQFDKHVEILKGLSTKKISSVIEYGEEEIDHWLIDYSIKNQDIEESIHGISHDLRDLEGELFNIKIRHEINFEPMKNYIEYWFKRAIDKLTREGQEMTVGIVPKTAREENKRTKESK
jgi:bisphosphoglycerate-dependent phosphoglycerate mutase